MIGDIMSDGTPKRSLTPFEEARLNLDVFTANMTICAGFQEVVQAWQECEKQLASGCDPELRRSIELERDHLSAKVQMTHKMMEAMDIYTA